MSKEIMLFAEFDLLDVMRRAEQSMCSEIDQIEADSLLNTSVEDLSDYMEKEYSIQAPIILEDKVTLDHHEWKVNYQPATIVEFFVPFEGHPHLLRCRASTFLHSPPRARLEHGQLVLSYTWLDHDAAAARAELDRALANIKQCLAWAARDVAPFNESLRAKARKHIEARRNQLLKDKGMAAALGFPLRRREGAPQTYVVPDVRKKPAIVRPTAAAEPFVREPTLDNPEYEHILSVIQNMVAVMERSPGAFRTMKEEDLRQHFLVQLNGQYEGQATGETFNFEGKTDILIRVDGKNIFIAECMFWDGPKSLHEKIDQLLGYASWRDTKTAVLVFNRQKNFTDVLAKIPEVVKAHPNFKRQEKLPSESGFRFILHHRDDKNRELILTVLAFEVPA